MRDLLNIHAAEILGMPDDWQLYSYEVLGEKLSPRIYKLKGCTVLKNMFGETTWTYQNNQELYIPKADHEQWAKAWSEKTGNCIPCVGKGKTLLKWTADEGSILEDCKTCGGTGKNEHN